MRTVHLRGTAYEFNNVKILLRGATIRVAEFPKLSAVVRPDGRYDLVVPDHAKLTPYIVDPGYHTIYLQTFTTNGEDLANVNFQTPTEAVYRGLVALLHVPVDSQGNLVLCAIVTTFNTPNVRDLTFKQFIAYGAHGVASATRKPGWVVNANPPWGLWQLGRRNPAHVSARWSVRGARTDVSSLAARGLPAGADGRVSCNIICMAGRGRSIVAGPRFSPGQLVQDSCCSVLAVGSRLR